ncbi:hypothetical protein H4R18_004457 [Coemansia javaensis]|uniref:ArfGap-domain-containing protein n=1 Tax=Coemansia javaensis TaxID=2761396 RepID=A0A9W8LH27_9FUNG|nr:hypothetical protein H4R18_004457 [Coemansia javaensis]
MSCHELGLLDVEECLTDSPRVRGKVRRFEEYAHGLEGAVQGLSRASRQLQAAAAEYGERSGEVVRRVAQLAQHSPMADGAVERDLAEYAGVVAEIERNRQMQSEQLQQILVRPLEALADAGGLVAAAKAARRRTDALQSDYEAQLARLMGRRATEPLLEQQALEVQAAKSQYVGQMQRLALDYNRLASLKKVELLESFLSLMYAQYAFYHQAYSSLHDFEPTMRRMGERIAQLRHRAEDCLGEAAPHVVSPARGSRARAGSLDDDGSGGGGGYMRVGQQDDDGAYDSVNSIASMAAPDTPSNARDVATIPDAPGERPASPRESSSMPAQWRAASRQKRLSLASISLSPHGQFQMSGYLFLRSQYSLMASWQRRWFEIADGALVHFQRDDEKDREAVPLHLCMVKRGATQDRRNVFELIAPSRTYILQAETADELNAWKACLRQAIEASLYAHTPSGGAPLQRASSQPALDAAPLGGGEPHPASSQPLAAQAARLARLRRPRGNGRCVDCGQAAPEWAAINLGALMCIECSGIHRSLGVHVTRVRSVKLDNWEPELVQIMQRLGNARVNRIYEAARPAAGAPPRPTPHSRREERLPYLRLKYADRALVAPDPAAAAAAKLMRAAAAADIALALEALAQGASPNAHDSDSGCTPLMAAVGMGDFGILELLLLWGADVNARAKVTATAYMNDSPRADSAAEPELGAFGGTALHLAVRLGNVRVVWYLIRKGAQWDTPDAYGLLPLDIALEDSNVQVVMALRYAAFQRASGLPPGTLGSKRPRAAASSSSSTGASSLSVAAAAAAEPVDMLDMDDSFIRDWAIPPYLPSADDDDDDAESEKPPVEDGAKPEKPSAEDGAEPPECPAKDDAEPKSPAPAAASNRTSAEFTELADSATHAIANDDVEFAEPPQSPAAPA